MSSSRGKHATNSVPRLKPRRSSITSTPPPHVELDGRSSGRVLIKIIHRGGGGRPRNGGKPRGNESCGGERRRAGGKTKKSLAGAGGGDERKGRKRRNAAAAAAVAPVALYFRSQLGNAASISRCEGARARGPMRGCGRAGERERERAESKAARARGERRARACNARVRPCLRASYRDRRLLYWSEEDSVRPGVCISCLSRPTTLAPRVASRRLHHTVEHYITENDEPRVQSPGTLASLTCVTPLPRAECNAGGHHTRNYRNRSHFATCFRALSRPTPTLSRAPYSGQIQPARGNRRAKPRRAYSAWLEDGERKKRVAGSCGWKRFLSQL